MRIENDERVEQKVKGMMIGAKWMRQRFTETMSDAEE